MHLKCEKAMLAAFFLLMPPATIAARGAENAATVTKYVDPFIGTAQSSDKFGFSGDSGDVFPGALCPRGLVQFSPDTISNLPGGYKYEDNVIKGFSMTHFSGRGCTAYQDVPFMPVTGSIGQSPLSTPATYYATFSHTNETARPGYYHVHLDSGIEVDLTATLRTGFANVLFPVESNSSILVNSCGSVNGNGDPTEFHIVGTHEVYGTVTSHIGCGKEKYALYFVTEFNQPFITYGVWSGATINSLQRSAEGGQSGVYLTFDTRSNRVVCTKTGISYVSLADARENLNSEDSGWNFDAVAHAADRSWNTVLSRIWVSGSDTDKRVFYTALYHSFIHPNIFNDCNGKYMGFDGVVHQLDPGRNHYENIPGWDEYRCLIPLQALLVPNETSDVAQSLVDDAIQGGGGLPRWQQTSHNSAGMVGDSPLIILATAYAYGATNFDSQAALIAMQEDASIPTTMSDGHIVRKGCDDYLTKGFIPGTGYETASSTLEYCSDDFALSRLAAALGRDKLRLQYLGQAENWKNLFNPANGYINPRNTDGSWVANFDPASQSGFVEGSSCQYTWMVPFNLGTLFQKMGGSGVAAGRLDSFFAKLNDGPGSDYAFMGNEPSFEIPWEYDWAGRPSGTQAVVRRIQDQLFNDRPNGLPGNDDGGAMSSWYVWSAIGLYPEIPGVAGFAIGSPRFTRVQIFPAGRPEIQIIARNGADGNPYVKSVHVNGQAQRTSWISCDRLSNGGNVSFDLGPSPTSWGTGADSVPPSFDAKPSVIAGAN